MNDNRDKIAVKLLQKKDMFTLFDGEFEKVIDADGEIYKWNYKAEAYEEQHPQINLS